MYSIRKHSFANFLKKTLLRLIQIDFKSKSIKSMQASTLKIKDSDEYLCSANSSGSRNQHEVGCLNFKQIWSFCIKHLLLNYHICLKFKQPTSCWFLLPEELADHKYSSLSLIFKVDTCIDLMLLLLKSIWINLSNVFFKKFANECFRMEYIFDTEVFIWGKNKLFFPQNMLRLSQYEIH